MAQTLAEIREALKVANRAEYEVLARALAADERKGVKTALKSAARRLAAPSPPRVQKRASSGFHGN